MWRVGRLKESILCITTLVGEVGVQLRRLVIGHLAMGLSLALDGHHAT